MYGKHFASMYEGSMVGLGPTVFAVWGYCIAKADRDDHTVMLNPVLIAQIIGTTTEDIEQAILVLTSPDENSKNRDEGGKRLIHESGFSYMVVSHEHYRDINNRADVREYERLRKQKQRSKDKVPDCPGQTGTPVSVSVSSSSSEGECEGENKKPKLSMIEREFEDIWKLYPNKSGKTNARKAYVKARKGGEIPDAIFSGLNRYMKYVEIQRKNGFNGLKYKNGSTWFNQKCWEDEYTIVLEDVEEVSGVGKGSL